jgi:hypothetical protein
VLFFGIVKCLFGWDAIPYGDFIFRFLEFETIHFIKMLLSPHGVFLAEDVLKIPLTQ